ncbi:hypothetical protein DFQ28_006716 [Apophysomyces sp. BC1034]|nr:hypothetical protein DFQ29_005465 [Apophysomyces sp. BC1021]KAG0187204.1 hypothetical protein DFQ28_006716 [Apophysomyces sp. BC1034]
MESLKDQVATTSFQAASNVPSTSSAADVSSASLPTDSATAAVSSASITTDTSDATDSATGAVSSASIVTDTSDTSHTPNGSNAFTIQEMHIQLDDSFINMTKDDTDDDPWIYNNINISRLFKVYQTTVIDIIRTHKTIPLESYIHELAALTHIIILCKDQHSLIAQNVFSLDLLQDLSSPDLHAMNLNLDFSVENFIAINTIITNLNLKTSTRNQAFMDLTTLTTGMEYGPKRIILGINSLIQGLPVTPLNDYKEIGESELWCTYFNPLLSFLISDPDQFIHLRWTNTIPNEKNGKTRPDAVVSEKLQLSFGANIGFGEAKVQKGSGSRVSLCLDTLRLAIFTKNAIDVNGLDAAIAFQIHGFNITFYLHRLTAKGIYTFTEITHFRFPQSLEDLPSFVTLVNIKKMLGINEVFWRLCKKSLCPDVVKARYKATQVNLDSMMDTTHDGTRRCILRYGN